MEMKVTSILDLQEYAKGAVVELPGFAEGQPFVARLRRPSMLVLAKSGKIPNELLATADSLFNGTKRATNNPNALKEITGILEIMAEAALVEPSYSDLKEVGLDLTDEQFMAIFNYTQAGVRALDSFRSQHEPQTPAGNGAAV